MTTTFSPPSTACTRSHSAHVQHNGDKLRGIDTLSRQKWAHCLGRFYSRLLDENIDARLAVRILHAQLSLTIALLPVALPVWWHVLTVGWCVWSSHAAWQRFRATSPS